MKIFSQFEKQQASKILAMYNTPEVEETPYNSLEKGGKKAMIGEVREWSGQKWVKHQDGWVHFNQKTGNHVVEDSTGKRRPAEPHHIEHAKKHLGSESNESRNESALKEYSDNTKADFSKLKDEWDTSKDKFENNIFNFLKDKNSQSKETSNYQKLVDAGYSESDAEDFASEYEQGGSKTPTKVKEILDGKVSKLDKFLDILQDIDSSIKDTKGITVEATPKGNWQIFKDGKELSVIDSTLLDEDTIRDNELEHHEEDYENGQKFPGDSEVPVVEKKTKSTVSDKDWDRMLALLLSEKEGVASTITDKNKAVNRFVAGRKILDGKIEHDSFLGKEFRGFFSNFGNRALELGATKEEIEEVFNNTEVPDRVKEKVESRKGKKLGGFITPLSLKLLDAGFDIEFPKYNGNALTTEGNHAMRRNGRKWTIGYKTEINIGNGKKVNLDIDAITDEGGGPTSYIVSRNSDRIFTSLSSKTEYGQPIGITELTKTVLSILDANK